MVAERPVAHIRNVTGIKGVVEHSVDTAEGDGSTAGLFSFPGRKSPLLVYRFAYLPGRISAGQQYVPHPLYEVVAFGVAHSLSDNLVVLRVD